LLRPQARESVRFIQEENREEIDVISGPVT